MESPQITTTPTVVGYVVGGIFFFFWLFFFCVFCCCFIRTWMGSSHAQRRNMNGRRGSIHTTRPGGRFQPFRNRPFWLIRNPTNRQASDTFSEYTEPDDARYITTSQQFHVPSAPTRPAITHNPRRHTRKTSSSALPKHFEAVTEDVENPCVICLEPLKSEPVTTGKCLHPIHTSCLNDWLAKDSRYSCPVCRREYVEEDELEMVFVE